MRNVQLAHRTLAEVMENERETGLTRTKAAQAQLLYDGQRLRARAEIETVHTVLDKVRAVVAALPDSTIEAEFVELAEGDSPEQPI